MELVWGARDFVDVGGTSVHVEVAGPVDGPVLVGLHGFASGTFTWAGIAPLLTDRHRLVAWDRPPFGRSDRPRPTTGPDDPYALPAELARTRALTDELVGRHEVVLLGHSAGTLLAVQAALAGVVAVRGLVLVAPALDGAPPDLVRRLASAPGASAVGPVALRLALRGATPVVRLVGRHRTPLLDATAAETGRALNRPGTAAALWHLTSTWQPPDVEGWLGDVDRPAIVIGGREDRIGSVAAHEDVAARLGAELHLLDGVGHAAHEQVPDVVASLVAGFVEGLGS